MATDKGAQLASGMSHSSRSACRPVDNVLLPEPESRREFHSKAVSGSTDATNSFVVNARFLRPLDGTESADHSDGASERSNATAEADGQVACDTSSVTCRTLLPTRQWKIQLPFGWQVSSAAPFSRALQPTTGRVVLPDPVWQRRRLPGPTAALKPCRGRVTMPGTCKPAVWQDFKSPSKDKETMDLLALFTCVADRTRGSPSSKSAASQSASQKRKFDTLGPVPFNSCKHANSGKAGKVADVSKNKAGPAVAPRLPPLTLDYPNPQMSLPGGLTICELGKVEFLNPRFHSKEHIFPIGYHAIRELSGYGLREFVELKIQSEDDGPVFRIFMGYPDGKLLIKCTSLSAAWDSISNKLPSTSKVTEPEKKIGRMFGLSHAQTVSKLMAMEGAPYLCKLKHSCAGAPKARQPMPPDVFRQHKRTAAAAYRLPKGVVPQPIERHCTGECDICHSDTETAEVRLLCCGKCGIMVHNTCYGTVVPELGSVWLCELCEAGISVGDPPTCALCPCKGGSMRFTQCGQWVHNVCALWIPEVTLESGKAPCLDAIDPKRCAPNLRCTVCQQPYGAHFQCCAGRKCYTAWHPLCQRNAGLPCVAVDEHDSQAIERLERAMERHVPMNAWPVRGGMVDTAGVVCGNGIRLLAFCRKHACIAHDGAGNARQAPLHIERPDHVRALQDAEKLNGMVLPPSMTAAGKTVTCSRMLHFSGQASTSAQKPDMFTVACCKQQYVSGMPAAPVLTGLPYSDFVRCHQSPFAELGMRQGASSAAASACATVCASPSRQPPTTDLQRYNLMHDTLRMRLSAGKSCIHGFGMFTRLPIRKGDWVIEYMGELIRPPVLDMREKRLYNNMIGCGTYTFRLPYEDRDMCLDATRCGNGAQLLNHSCSPNCFSVTKTIQFKQGAQHKIIIISRRDIAAGEELTYDYRFSGDEVMACFCGAKECKGVVNYDEHTDGQDYLVPRDEAEFISWSVAQKHLAEHGRNTPEECV